VEIQWFPGHMAKTRRLIQENLKLVDLVLELLDARIPQSSSNPELKNLIGNREKIIVLNKADLADPRTTQLWKKYFQDMGFSAVEVDAVKGKGIKQLLDQVRVSGGKIKFRWEKRGRKQKNTRIMIVGIPNVGKSSLINRISRSSSARTGEKPGVTRGKQWIRVDREIMLLDTPGILWPKLENEKIGVNLASVGAIKEQILDKEELAAKFIETLMDIDDNILKNRYGLKNTEQDVYKVLSQIGLKRGCLMGGNKIDTLRAAGILFDDFRSGRLGRISLEKPCSTLD